MLLKQKVKPHQAANGAITWVGAGKETVNQHAIKERFESLGVPLDWRRFKNINDIRNNTEHYHFEGTRIKALEAFAEACVLIRQLITDVLNEDPIALIGESAWNRLYDNMQVFDEEYRACQATLSPLAWLDAAAGVSKNISCPKCNSRLVRQRRPENLDQHSAEFHCTCCTTVVESTEMVLYVLDEMHWAEGHVAAKDGGEPPVIDCPECGKASYVLDAGGCALCDFSVPSDAECALCGESLSPEDYYEHDVLCSYHAYVAERERDR